MMKGIFMDSQCDALLRMSQVAGSCPFKSVDRTINLRIVLA